MISDLIARIGRFLPFGAGVAVLEDQLEMYREENAALREKLRAAEHRADDGGPDIVRGKRPTNPSRSVPMPDFALPAPPPGCAPFRYPSDPLQFIAWRDFIAWAIGEPEMQEAFRQSTGLGFVGFPKSELEAAIDDATGADRDRDETLPAFIEWLNASHWGDDMVSWQPSPKGIAQDA